MKKRKAFLLVTSASLILLIAWIIWGNISIKVSQYTVSSSDLPVNFDGFRIVQISDLHNTSFGKGNQNLLSIIREASPDVILITGDLIDYYDPDPDISLAFVEKAVQIAPCYYVTGNHETRLTKEYPPFREQLIKMGVTVLEDSSVLYEIEGQFIGIAGLCDYASVSGQYIDSILSNESYNILLSHKPDSAEAFGQSEADLVLCGHTHGGQMRLPIVGAVYAPGQGLFPEYDAGLFRLDDTTMIISQGLGNSSIPFRVNCRPELVVVDLEAK